MLKYFSCATNAVAKAGEGRGGRAETENFIKQTGEIWQQRAKSCHSARLRSNTSTTKYSTNKTKYKKQLKKNYKKNDKITKNMAKNISGHMSCSICQVLLPFAGSV